MCSAVFVPSVTLLVSALCTTESTFATEDRMVTSLVLMESCVPQSKPVVWFFTFILCLGISYIKKCQ